VFVFSSAVCVFLPFGRFMLSPGCEIVPSGTDMYIESHNLLLLRRMPACRYCVKRRFGGDMFLETLVYTISTRRHIPVDGIPHSHPENTSSYNFYFIFNETEIIKVYNLLSDSALWRIHIQNHLWNCDPNASRDDSAGIAMSYALDGQGLIPGGGYRRGPSTLTDSGAYPTTYPVGTVASLP
jgi:hypothetical protein